MSDNLKKFLFYWLPVLIWTGVIFYLSSKPGLKIGLTTPMEALVRKGFHVIEFGILALLLWRLFRIGFDWPLEKTFIWSFVIAVSFAASDEIHQVFVENRSGRLEDFLVDTLAILIVLQSLYLASLKRRKLFHWLALLFSIILLLFQIGLIVSEAQKSCTIAEKSKQETKKIVEEAKKQGNPEIGNRNSENKERSEGNQKDERDKREEGEEREGEGEDAISLPDEIHLKVPFTSQAPFAVWDDVHEEACEETSLIMVKYFLDGSELAKISPADAEKEIQKMKDFQVENYGTYKDSDMEELVVLAEEFYQINNLKVIYGFSKEDLKKELAKENPIIIPTAGRELGNPNFTSPGPLYHNLVLIGYDGGIIITNDPGTRRGKDYKYNIDVLYNSIHDFPGDKDKISEGRKAMIVIE